MVGAIRSQPSEPVLQTWSDGPQLIRAIFFRAGWGDGKVRMDSTALDSIEKVPAEDVLFGSARPSRRIAPGLDHAQRLHEYD